MFLDETINADVTSFPFGSLAACDAELTQATVFAHGFIKPLIFDFLPTSETEASHSQSFAMFEASRCL